MRRRMGTATNQFHFVVLPKRQNRYEFSHVHDAAGRITRATFKWQESDHQKTIFVIGTSIPRIAVATRSVVPPKVLKLLVELN